jgi:hypothetical protein
MSKVILSEAQQVLGTAIRPALGAVAYVVVLVLVALLIAVGPVFAVSVAAVLGGTYGLIY